MGFIVVLFLLALVGLLAYGIIVSAKARPAPSPHEQARLRQLEAENRAHAAFLHHLDKVAHSHRELDSPLSTIVIDEIARFKERQLGPGGNS